MKLIEEDKFKVELLEPRVIKATLFEDSTIEKDDILQLYENNRILSKGEKYVLLIKANFNASVTKEAREVSADGVIARNRIALAFVVESLAQKLLVNFFIKFNKPSSPTKLFTEEQDALAWLKEFL